MNPDCLRPVLYELFPDSVLDGHTSEWGVTINSSEPICGIGYATTLNPDVVRQAEKVGVNLVVTHHDCWDFMFEAREQTYQLLEMHGINHLFLHTPLDAADFGTSASLLSRAGCTLADSFATEDGLAMGRTGYLPSVQSFESIKETLCSLLDETPAREFDCGIGVKKIGIATGAGSFTQYLREAQTLLCDLYVTGETSLYLLDYATHIGISVLVYSHNYTEIFGVECMVELIRNRLQVKKVLRLVERHY